MKPTYGNATATALGLLFAATAMAAPMASPGNITFRGYDDSKTITVTSDGNPVAVSSVKLMVEDHDYDHMISVQAENGKFTVSPTKDMEKGTYDLAITTPAGKTMVRLHALMFDTDAQLQARADQMGITVEELRKRLGISDSPGRERIHLGIPGMYYTGQTLTINMNAPEGRTYKWTVNGKTVKEGSGPGTLEYEFPAPGTYNVVYTEMQDGKAVASDSELVEVENMPGR